MRTRFLSFLFLLSLSLFFFFSFSKSYAQYGANSVSGYLFQDLNLSESYDAGEPILHHGTKPFGITSDPLGTVTYPATGRSYQVTGLPTGNSAVRLVGIPAGYIPYYPTGNPPFHLFAVGAICNPGTGSGHGATCSSGSVNNLNFALRRINKISGTTFQDVNLNGTYEALTDQPLWPYAVTITNNSGTPLSACSGISNCSCTGATCTNTTDASGNYTFGPLFAGSYSVAFTPPSGYNTTSPSPVTVTIQ